MVLRALHRPHRPAPRLKTKDRAQKSSTAKDGHRRPKERSSHAIIRKVQKLDARIEKLKRKLATESSVPRKHAIEADLRLLQQKLVDTTMTALQRRGKSRETQLIRRQLHHQSSFRRRVARAKRPDRRTHTSSQPKEKKAIRSQISVPHGFVPRAQNAVKVKKRLAVSCSPVHRDRHPFLAVAEKPGPSPSTPPSLSKEDVVTMSSVALHRTDDRGWTPLVQAVMVRDLRGLCALIEAGADPNQPSTNTVAGNHAAPLHVAAAVGMATAVDALLVDALADPCALTDDGATFLHSAVQEGQIAIVELVVDIMLDPLLSDTYNSKNVARLVESATLRCNCKEDTILHTAVRHALSEKLISLICRIPGFPVDAVDASGMSALDIVCAKERVVARDKSLPAVRRRRTLASYRAVRALLAHAMGLRASSPTSYHKPWPPPKFHVQSGTSVSSQHIPSSVASNPQPTSPVDTSDSFEVKSAATDSSSLVEEDSRTSGDHSSDEESSEAYKNVRFQDATRESADKASPSVYKYLPACSSMGVIKRALGSDNGVDGEREPSDDVKSLAVRSPLPKWDRPFADGDVERAADDEHREQITTLEAESPAIDEDHNSVDSQQEDVETVVVVNDSDLDELALVPRAARSGSHIGHSKQIQDSDGSSESDQGSETKRLSKSCEPLVETDTGEARKSVAFSEPETLSPQVDENEAVRSAPRASITDLTVDPPPRPIETKRSLGGSLVRSHADDSDFSSDHDSDHENETAVSRALNAEPDSEPSTPHPTKEEREAAMTAKKRHVVAELVSSQKKYVKQIVLLRDCFQRPMREAAQEGKNPHFQYQDYNSLFANLEAIVNLDEKFRDDLELEIEKPEELRSIGRLVNEFVNYFKLYSDYCNAHEKSTKSLKQLGTKKKFKDLLAGLTANPRLGGFTMESLLITPIQRLPRLKMLLEEMLSCTPQQDPQRELLEHATKQIAGVTQKVNDTIGERANRLKVFEIQQCLRRFKGQLVAAHRVFLREGDLEKACRRGVVKPRYCFLFSDLFIYTRKAGRGQYDYKHSLHVRRVEPLHSLDPLERGVGSRKSKNVLYVCGAMALMLLSDLNLSTSHFKAFCFAKDFRVLRSSEVSNFLLMNVMLYFLRQHHCNETSGSVKFLKLSQESSRARPLDYARPDSKLCNRSRLSARRAATPAKRHSGFSAGCTHAHHVTMQCAACAPKARLFAGPCGV